MNAETRAHGPGSHGRGETSTDIVPAFTIAEANGARRTRQLTIAANLLYEGHYPEPAWGLDEREVS